MVALFVISVLLSSFCWFLTECSTNWRVTESGRIESHDDSPFTLLRPYDLVVFMKQADRAKRLEQLKKLITSKEKTISIKKDPNAIEVASYQEKFYSSDPDCIKAGQQLTKFTFFETYLISWHTNELTLPKEIMQIPKSTIKVFKKPYCDSIDLPFNMGTYDHFDSIQSKENITMVPELDLLKNILVEPEELFGHFIHLALLTNATSWVFQTMASDYFRIVGDYQNSIKCLQRALYYVPKSYQNIPRLSLSNMLHKLNFINESLSIALSNIVDNVENSIFCYYIGNIYVTLGELNQALQWYERASQSSDPKFQLAYLKKHAVMCQIKLETYLENQHESLQKKLHELKDYQSNSEEWFQLSSKFELEKSSPDRREFTKNAYKDFLTKTHSVICDWNDLGQGESDSGLKCHNLEIHYSYFPFDYYKNLSSILEYVVEMSSLENNDQRPVCTDSEVECRNLEESKMRNTNNGNVQDLEEDEPAKDALTDHILREKSIKVRLKPPIDDNLI